MWFEVGVIAVGAANLGVLIFMLPPLRKQVRKLQDNEIHDIKKRLTRIESLLIDFLKTGYASKVGSSLHKP